MIADQGNISEMRLVIDRDDDGELVVTGAPPDSLLPIFLTDDVGDDLVACEHVLGIVVSVKAGVHPPFQRTYNATQLDVTPDGATLCWAGRMPGATIEHVTLDELAAALGQLRITLTS